MLDPRCSPVSKFPFSRMGAIGGLVLQQFPILCGGHGFGWKDEIKFVQPEKKLKLLDMSQGIEEIRHFRKCLGN